MAEESDGIGEAFDGQIRIALAAAMQMAQHVARLREELARNSQARTEQQTRELSVRFDAERSAASASLAPVDQPGWWDIASVSDIAYAFETAEAWTPIDREMHAARDRMREELRSRYGIDVNSFSADPTAVRDAIERAQQARTDAAYARGESTQDYAEAASLLSVADQLDSESEAARREANDESKVRAADAEPRVTLSLDAEEARIVAAGLRVYEAQQEHQTEKEAWEGEQPAQDVIESAEVNARRSSELRERLSKAQAEAQTTEALPVRDDAAATYESAERRESFAADMETKKVDPELQKVRLAADRENGTHPSAAVATKPRKQRKARTSSQTPGLTRDRGGLTR